MSNRKDRHIPLKLYYEAYYEFRKHCRDSEAQQVFEKSYAYNLFAMRRDVVTRHIDLGASYCFIVNKPKPREVFAGSVYKRILDTLCMMTLKPYMEGKFSYRQYNVRKGFGLSQYQEQLKEDMKNADKDDWILGLDIKGFFMSVDRKIAWKLWEEVIMEWYGDEYTEDLLYIMHEIVFYAPEYHCVKKSPDKMWNKIPKEKSLFTNGEGTGMPIGDLISQYTALLILRTFALWLESEVGKCGIYMDDSYAIGKHDKLLEIIPKARKKLKEVGLRLNENKTYFQPIRHGIKTCGAVVFPNRSYVSNRVVKNAFDTLLYFNDHVNGDSSEICQGMNSYMGIFRHFDTYNIRKDIVRLIPPEWWGKIYIKGHYEIFKERERYGSKRNLR